MRVLIAVAHADDEVLGCFSVMASCEEHEVFVLHATNSTPLNPMYATRAGFATIGEYEIARRAEMLCALDAAGFPRERWRALPIADQGTPDHVSAIREAAASYQADVIYTHAYEGGHPDHDAMAYAMSVFPNVVEFPIYHADEAGEMRCGRFYDGEASEVVALGGELLARKRAALDCFATQQRVIVRLPATPELFRPMRKYDFDKPPHEGRLYYEVRGHGWTWADWHRHIIVS